MSGALLRRDEASATARRLYAACVAQARQPAFYARGGVPDTVEGRFDLLSLHVFLVLRRLGGTGRTDPLAQRLTDVMFRDMEDNLRELGVGDSRIPKRVRGLAEEFAGRVRAYDEAIAEGEATLAGTLGRNILGREGAQARGLAAYTLRAEATLTGREVGIRAGELAFPRYEETDHAAT